MATKRQAQRAADSDLQAFLNEATERFRPDAAVLAARIDTVVQRYMAMNTTQRFDGPAPLAMLLMQEKILDGWRYNINIPQSVHITATGNMSVTLRKPAELVEQEVSDLKRQVEAAYHNELANTMEREIDQLVQDAAKEAQRHTEEAAAAERDAMRQRLKDMLLTGASV
ncbi:hypothetical protein SAMN03159434_11833 [Enterobacter sp. NFR05]|nr:hypothetical protein SAMN03159434_11833 [Enterobacter sp. NFR05]